MQRVIVFALAIVAAQSLDKELIAEFVEKVTDIGSQCAEKTNASGDDVASIMKHKTPGTKEGKCMISCFYKTVHLQNEDGSFNPDFATIDWMEKIKKNDEILHGQFVKIFEECLKPELVLSDQCQTAANAALCGVEAGKKVGLPSELMSF